MELYGLYLNQLLWIRRYLENATMCHQWLLDYFDPICAKPGLVPSRCCEVCASKKEMC